ncbi:MAG TPA: LCP family protein [Actinospica sp.]|nr:LCP family protein [Actinospica sp.]
MSAPDPEELLPEQASTYGGMSGKRARPRRGKNADGGGDDGRGGNGGGGGSGGGDGFGAGPAAAAPKRRRWGLIIGLTALGLVVVLVGVGIGSWIWASSKITHVGALTDYSGRPAQGAGTNWLLAGSDSRDSLTPQQVQEFHTGSSSAISGSRTDTIMIVHYGSSGPDLVSIPRDSYVEIPAYKDSKGVSHSAQHGKINSAYDLGGPQLLVQTVEVNFGIRIDHYLEVGFLGIVNMVNEAGGVHLCLSSAIHDSYSGANLSAGCQTLNGTEALAYVRSRYSLPNSDVSRMSDQQAFIKGLVQAADRPGVYLDPFTLYPFMSAVLNSVAADDGTGLSDLLDLAQHAKPLASSGGSTGTMPIANESYYVSGIGDAVKIDQTKAAELADAINKDEKIPAGLLNSIG